MVKIRFFLIIALVIFSNSFAFGSDKCLKIHFLDVGEGDSILIETPENKTILVDGGNLISGFKVREYLKKNNIDNLDHLIFTHPDFDHIGGAFFILQMLQVKNIYDNGEDLNQVKSFDVYRWYEKLVRKRKNYNILKANDVITFGEVTLKVLWPPQPLLSSDFNANSIAIMLEYGEFRCFLTGDLTITGEQKLLAQGGINLKADVLKIGHHGAADATCEEFLRNISPKIAILSVDAENVRGYPKKEAIDKLKKVGVKLYRTDINGDIILSIYRRKDSKTEIKIKTDKNEIQKMINEREIS